VVRVLHCAVKGRTRYKIEGLHRSESFKEHIEAKVSTVADITYVSANTLTGNVLVCYNSQHTAKTISGLLENLIAEYVIRSGAIQKATKNRKNSSASKPSLFKNIFLSSRPTSRKQLRKLVTKAEGQETRNWHAMESGEALLMLGASKSSGLSRDRVKEIQKRYGPNVLPESVPRSGFSIIVDQFKSLPVLLLGAAAAVSLLTGGLADAAVIMGVVAINATIGYVTENQSEKMIHSLKHLVTPTALVLRDKKANEINAEEVVPGDILVLRPGTYVPADARLIFTKHLSVDESALTGESVPVHKTTASIQKEDLPLADRTNMIYMGTLVTGGQGLAVVVATGRFTEMGKIQILVGEAISPETPMEKQLGKMGRQLVLLSSAVCGVVFIIGLLRGYGFLQMLKTSISLAVAAVPEGLPAVATTTLALGIRKMRRHNVLMRHLPAVETLGSVQTICLDKTGTLTKNQMTVVTVYSGLKRYAVSNGLFLNDAKPVNPYSSETLLLLLHASALCNESEVISHKKNFIVNGSATENALIYAALAGGVNVPSLREQFPMLAVYDRSENRNYMYTLHSTATEGQRLVALKGSPDEVLAMCEWHMKDGVKSPLGEDERAIIEEENERMAGEALRLLGVAYCPTGKELPQLDHSAGFRDELIWLGLVGMIDPVRTGIEVVIDQFHQAGINTVMITGDQSPTAYAVSQQLGLSGNGQLEILDSTHLANIEPEVLRGLCERVHVFSRVSPAHKLQIVQALQQAGKVVAMTGDGINDAPALKAADIGIAMGHTGTDVAREVADVVLEDDNLETMVIAIGQGRTIYNNIRKSLHFLLSTNFTEIMVEFTGITLGLGEPLNTRQLLWINLLSDIFPGLALAMEPPEPDVLTNPPRDPNKPIIGQADFKRISFESAVISAGSLASYGYGIMRYGRGPHASTLAFTSLTIGQLLHAISCRSEKHSIFSKDRLAPNRYLTAALGGTLALQGAAMVIPGIRSFLGITPITLIDGLVVGCGAFLPLLVNEATKQKGLHS